MNNLFFLDETGFNLHIAANYKYGLDRNRPYYIFPANRGSNVSLLTLISNTSILYHKNVYKYYTSNLLLKFKKKRPEIRILIENKF